MSLETGTGIQIVAAPITVGTGVFAAKEIAESVSAGGQLREIVHNHCIGGPYAADVQTALETLAEEEAAKAEIAGKVEAGQDVTEVAVQAGSIVTKKVLSGPDVCEVLMPGSGFSDKARAVGARVLTEVGDPTTIDQIRDALDQLAGSPFTLPAVLASVGAGIAWIVGYYWNRP